MQRLTLALLGAWLVLMVVLFADAQEGIWEDSLPLNAGGWHEEDNSSGNFTVNGAFSLGPVDTWVFGDTTPEVVGASNFVTNTLGITVTSFDGTISDGHLMLVREDTAMTYQCSSGTTLNCGDLANFTPEGGDVSLWGNTDGKWVLLGHFDANGNNTKGKFIVDGTVLEPDLNEDGDSPSDDDVLTYDSTGTNFLWKTGDILGTDLRSANSAAENLIQTTHSNNDMLFMGGPTAEIVKWNFGSSNRLNFHTSSGITQVHFGGMDLSNVGVVAHEMSVRDQNSADSKTMGSTEMLQRWMFLSSVGTQQFAFNLVDSSEGWNVCFYDGDDTWGFEVDPDAADTIYLYGTALAAGEAINSDGNAGAQVCLVAVTSSIWIAHSMVGIWTEETP